MKTYEKKLVDAENDFWNVGASWAWCSRNVLHSEVIQVADEGTAGTAESQGVTPEHPLAITG
jgi:hypothetical protein